MIQSYTTSQWKFHKRWSVMTPAYELFELYVQFFCIFFFVTCNDEIWKHSKTFEIWRHFYEIPFTLSERISRFMYPLFVVCIWFNIQHETSLMWLLTLANICHMPRKHGNNHLSENNQHMRRIVKLSNECSKSRFKIRTVQ